MHSIGQIIFFTNFCRHLLGAILAFGVGHVNVDWSSYGESFLCLISIFQGADLIWFSQTGSLITGYILLVVYRTLYQILITIAR